MQRNKLAKFTIWTLSLGLGLVSGSMNANAALKLTDRNAKKGNFIFEEDPRSLVTSVDFVIRTGSVHDPKGFGGLAKLSFQAILRGTQRLSRVRFANAIEQLGATIQVDTRQSRTIISLYTISENLEAAIKLMAEAILEPAFRTVEISNLKSEHIAGLNQSRSSTPGLLFRAFRQEMYRGTPLAHPASGTIQSSKKITIRRMRAFLRKHLNSSNVLVAINTKMNKDRVKGYLERSFAGLKPGTVTPLPDLSVPKRTGRTLLILDRKGTTTANTILGHQYVSSDHSEMIELSLGNFIFGSGMTSRLFDELRNKTGWSYGAMSSFYHLDSPRSYGSTFTLYTFPATIHADKAIPKAVAMYEEYSTKGITPDELKFAVNSLGNSYAFKFAKASSRMNARIYRALDNAPYLSLDEYRNRINELRVGDLRRMIKANHDPKNFILAVAGDPKKLRKLAKLIPGITEIKVVKDPVARLR